MRTLIRKELGAIWPYILMALLLVADHLLEVLFGQNTLKDLALQPTLGLVSWMRVGGLLCFAAAHGSIVQEFRDGHIEFLNGLPVRRWRIYWAKVVAALSVVLILVAGSILSLWLAAFLSTDATHGSAGPALWSAIGLYTAGLLGFSGAGLLFSWFGGLGWALLGIGMVMLEIPGAVDLRLRSLSMGAYANLEFVGSTAVVYWWSAAVWLGWLSVCALISWIGFSGPGEALIQRSSRLLASGRRVLGLLALAPLVLTVFALVSPSEISEALLIDTRIVDTEHFRILYPVQDQEAAKKLIDRVEDIEVAVGGLLDTGQVPRVDLEFMGGGRFHAGRYTGGKIRMSLDGNAEDTLAHELTHAHAHSLAGDFAHTQHDSWRFFDEGLATWVAGQVVGSTVSISKKHLRAGALFERDQHRFDLLIRDKVRSLRFDSDEVYPLGLVFVEALVALEGKQSPACVSRAFGEVGATPVIGPALWYGAFNTCGYNLDQVVAGYNDLLRGYAMEHSSRAPELSASVEMIGDEVYLRVGGDRISVTRVFCRLKRDEDTKRSQMRVVLSDHDDLCAVPALTLGALSFYYQLGSVLSEDDSIIYGPWVSAAIPQASQGICDSLDCIGAALPPPWAADPTQGATVAVSRYEVQLGHSGTVTGLKYDPLGRFVATSSEDGTVRLWDSRGLRLIRVLADHHRPVVSFDVSADGGRLVSADVHTLMAWNTKTGALLWRRTFNSSIGGVDYDSDRQFLAVARRSGRRRMLDILDARDGKSLASIKLSKGRNLRTSQVLLDGGRAMVGVAGSVEVLDLRTGRELWQLDAEATVTRMLVAADGTQLIVSTRSGLNAYDAQTGERQWHRRIRTAGCRDIAYSPDGTQLLRPAEYGTLAVYDVKSGTERVSEVEGALRNLAFSPDGTHLAATHIDKLRLIRWPDLEVERSQDTPFRRIIGLALSPQGDLVASASPLQIYDLSDGSTRAFFSEPGPNYGLAFSSDGRSLGAGAVRAVFMFDAGPPWAFQSKIGRRSQAPDVQALIFTPGSQGLLLGDYKGGVTRLNLSNQAMHRTSLHTSRVVGLGVTAAQEGVSVEWEGDVVYWDLLTGQERRRYKTKASWHAAVSPDAGKIALAHNNGDLVVNEVADNRRVAQFTPGHGDVRRVAFSSDGRYLLAGAEYGYVTVFELETHRRVMGVQAHHGDVAGLEFLPDGTGFVSSGADGTWAVWDFPSGNLRYRVASDSKGDSIRWDAAGVPTATPGAERHLHRVDGFKVTLSR